MIGFRLGYQGGALMTSSFKREKREGGLFPGALTKERPCQDTEGSIYKSKWALARHPACHTLILPVSRAVREKLLLFKLPSL